MQVFLQLLPWPSLFLLLLRFHLSLLSPLINQRVFYLVLSTGNKRVDNDVATVQMLPLMVIQCSVCSNNYYKH